MPVVTPRRWQLKPPTGTRINFGSSLANGLISAYILNEAGGKIVLDAVTTARGGFGGSPVWTPGMNGPNLLFSAAGQFINAGDSDLYTTPGGFTAMVRMQLTSTANDVLTVFGKDNTAQREWRMTYRSSLLSFRCNIFDNTGGGNLQVDTGSATVNSLAALTWYEIALVYNGGTTTAAVKTYINGRETTTGAALTGTFNTIQNTTSNLKIGNDDPGDIFKGNIEHAYLWNRPLSPGEIQQLYVDPYAIMNPPQQLKAFNTTGAAPAQDSLIGFLPMMGVGA